jgi:trans-aconitate methyltransferase
MPYLEMLPQELHEPFIQDVLDKLKTAYPPQSDNTVLFPFERLFVIACRH